MKNSKTPKTEKDKAPNLYVKYSTMAIQMGVTIGLGTWLGVYLDERFQTKPALTILLSLASIGVALYMVLKDVLKK
jgi:F0F1-type ATP synthase assembly protein I